MDKTITIKVQSKNDKDFDKFMQSLNLFLRNEKDGQIRGGPKGALITDYEVHPIQSAS